MSTGAVRLSCRDIGKSYGGLRALDGVSFDLAPGEVLGFIGPNGAGKTTLLDIVVGEQTADSGVVTVDGSVIKGAAWRRARRGRMARTFQYPQVATELSARENVVIGLKARSLSSAWRLPIEAATSIFERTSSLLEQAGEVCRSVGLDGIDRSCAALTLGELRLVEMARAFAQEPQVLLLDEPFAGADEGGIANMTNLVHRIAERGCGVVLVDHSVDVVARLVHRIVLMDQGRVIFDGPQDECLRSPQMREVYFGRGPLTGEVSA